MKIEVFAGVRLPVGSRPEGTKENSPQFQLRDKIREY